MTALVLESVDKRDLKSLGQKCPYGFDPRPEHTMKWQCIDNNALAILVQRILSTGRHNSLSHLPR